MAGVQEHLTVSMELGGAPEMNKGTVTVEETNAEGSRCEKECKNVLIDTTAE